jgi:hypothetical protein
MFVFHQFQWLLADNQRRIVEKLWQEFFSDPSQWWDHRLEKVNANWLLLGFF